MDFDINDFQVTIIDAGSDVVRVGFSGEDDPRFIFPSIVGRFKGD